MFRTFVAMIQEWSTATGRNRTERDPPASKWHKTSASEAQKRGTPPAAIILKEPGWGSNLYKDVALVVFSTLAGFTASGILANVYRLLAGKPESLGGRIGYVAVMVVAGPNVLLLNAAAALRAKAAKAPKRPTPDVKPRKAPAKKTKAAAARKA